MVIARELVDAMLAHARSEFPNEACGLLAGDGTRAVDFHAVKNADASPVRYRMDPMEQLRILDEIDEGGLVVAGIYHSHTRTQAYPSATDIELAFDPEPLYVIASLAYADAPDVRAFHIRDGNVSEEPVEITDG